MLQKFLSILIGTTMAFSLFLHADPRPLEGRQYGVEFNFPRLLTLSVVDLRSLSGTFSYFDYDNKAEIALPWFVGLFKDHNGNHDSVRHFDVVTTDIHYRKFLGDDFGGLYVSTFGRVAFLNSILDDEDRYKKTTKLGLGVGVGYRFFSKGSRLYWGAGIIFGRYVKGDNDIYRDIGMGTIDDSSQILDVELLKIGYAF